LPLSVALAFLQPGELSITILPLYQGLRTVPAKSFILCDFFLISIVGF
jgi:hypothetical protein